VPTSCRVSGPLRNTSHSARDRLLFRRSRTVVVLGLGIDLPHKRGAATMRLMGTLFYGLE
jgi:hypothetical protein